MAPIWLTKLNGALAWINPALSLIAVVLAAMVVVAVAERAQGLRATPSVQLAQSALRPSPSTCARADLPPEWRDMLLHD